MTVRALLFTDVVDSTLLVERLGDARAAELWTEHDRRARQLLARHPGREIDRTDGFFLLFDQAIDAVRYAVDYHQVIAGLDLAARVGIHVGAVTLRENDGDDVARGAKPTEVEGIAKPFAARLMALARGGQTLLSLSAVNALGGLPGAALGDALPEGTEIVSHGHYRLKGVEAPVEAFELGARGRSANAAPQDGDKAYRVVWMGDLWRPVREVRHNLPAERDAFIGRGAELRALALKLDAGARLLTVIGSGGTGKTRFVGRCAWTWLGDWPGGIYFCDLSEARSLDGIYFAVAFALGVPLGQDDPAVQLGHAIAGRGRCLVILDNFEQVVEHAPATLGRWLDRAGDAAFVVTSRERLHLPGEEIFPIEPLPIHREAIELFVTRARSQQPDFILTEANRDAVARIVSLLDGLPLAIELAAARVRLLSPAQIVERMRDRFALLAGARSAAARQATLRAAIDWSWDLLAPWEQAALAQCSVFEGGFTLDAAEAVLDLSLWAKAPPAMDAVQALVDKSLLRSWVPAQQSRYDIDEHYFGMYLSIHEYAAEKLRTSGPGAQQAAHEQHGKYFSQFGSEKALDALFRHGGVKRRRALALELDNLVAACRRAVGRGDANTAVAAYRAAWEVMELRGPFALGETLGAQVLALDVIAATPRAAALVARARAALRGGRMEDVATWLAQALTLSRELGDRRFEGIVLGKLGNLHRLQGRIDEARACYDQALGIHREVGNRPAEGVDLGSLGSLHVEQGQLKEAHAPYASALAVHREVGNRSDEGSLLGNLGVLHFEQGRIEEARADYDRALSIIREVGNRVDEGKLLGNLGNVFLEQGRLEEAAAHQEAALTIHREVGSRRFEGVALGNLGLAHKERGRPDEARANYEASLAIAREVGNRRLEGNILSSLGDLHHEQGRMEVARAHFEQAISILRGVGDRLLEGTVLGSLGGLLAKQARIGEAHEALRAGEALLRETGDRLELAKLLCIRGRVDAVAGDLDAACAALAEAETATTAMGARPESALSREIDRLRQALS